MHCNKCGEKIENEAVNSCPKCGTSIHNGITEKKQQKRTKTEIWLFIIAFCVFVVCIVVPFIPAKNSSKQNTTTASIQQMHIHTAPSDNTNYEKADFTKMNSYASKNGLGGTLIWLNGEYDKIEKCEDSSEGDYWLTTLVDEDGNKWLAVFLYEDDIEQYKKQKLCIAGMYPGYSTEHNMPIIYVSEIYNPANDIYTLYIATDILREMSKQCKLPTSTTDADPTQEETEAESEEQIYDDRYTNSIDQVSKEKVTEILAIWNYSGSKNGFLIHDSNTRFLTENELTGYTKMELTMIRNEILARHGWDFNNEPELHSYFITQQWYTPKYRQNDHVSFNEFEQANIALLEQMEDRAEKTQSSLTQGKFVELDFDENYAIAFDDYQTTLYLTYCTFGKYNNKTVEITYNGESILVFDEDADLGLYETDSVKLLNLPGKSFLLISGKTVEDYWPATFQYVLTKDGIEKCSFIGGKNTLQFINVKNAFCSMATCVIDDYMPIYDWEELNTEDNQIRIIGKSALLCNEKTLSRKLICYIASDNEIVERVLAIGDTVRFETIDGRQFQDTKIHMLEISLQTGETAYIPLFINENNQYADNSFYTQDGLLIDAYF